MVFDIPDNANQYGYAHDVKFILNSEKSVVRVETKINMVTGYRNLIDYIKYIEAHLIR